MDNFNMMKDSAAPLYETRALYSGFWRRLFAYFVDGLLVTFISAAIIVVPLMMLIAFDESVVVSSIASLAEIVLIVLLFFLYEAYFLSSSRMATPGKRLLGIQVTDMKGNQISFSRALLRSVIKLGLILVGSVTTAFGLPQVISFISWINVLNPFLIVFTEKKQAIHDHVAGTVVIRKYDELPDIHIQKGEDKQNTL